MQAHWVINYETGDVTDLIVPMVTSVTYTDNTHGDSDTLELGIEDAESLWRTGWYPAKGDRLDVRIGYVGQPLLPCGKFQVDEVDLEGPPSTVVLRTLAAGLGESLRTKQNRGFEDQSLREIVEKVTGELGMTLMGTIRDVKLKRVTQKDETPLDFLQRLAEEYGYAFNVRDTVVVFWLLADLEQQTPVLSFGRSELKRYRFTDTARNTYIACEVSYFDPDTGQTIKGRATIDNQRPHSNEPEIPTEVLRRKDAPDTGHIGELVEEVQIWLKSKGWYDYKIDRWFGPITERGTKILQAQSGLPEDGIWQAPTWRAAFNLGFRATADGTNGTGEILYKTERVESVDEAEQKAAAYLHRANRLQATGSLTLPGHPLLCSGVLIELREMLRLSGKYIIDRSVHRVSKSAGWVTEVEVTYVP